MTAERVSAPASASGPDARIPPGPIERKWDQRKFEMRLVNPANRRKYTVLVVGTGLAGGAAAASLGELGYTVECFTYNLDFALSE